MMLKSVLFVACAGAALALAAKASEKAFPYAYDQYDLANGLRLITVPTDFPNVVAVHIVVHVGSRNEVEPGKSGFAHFFEHMMFRGTKRFPKEKYEAVLREAGAASNAYTSDDRTVYHTTFSKEDLETILDMEADRFQNLDYSPEAFRTEALAVLGEYNKNAASPMMKLHERLRETAFERHTYKHTTMGFLKDIQDMPNQYAYSRQFFDRYYRPEYTTIVVVGDVKTDHVRALVEKYWGGWKRGAWEAKIPAEPPQREARSAHVEWHSPTLPWVWVAFKGPAYSDTERDQVTLDLIGFLGFSESSPLYKKLVLEEQSVDLLEASNPDHIDPYLFIVLARVKKPEDVPRIRDEILATAAGFRETPVDGERLEAVKSHVRYAFALRLDNSAAIADTLAHYVSLRRTPETINRLYELYRQVSPQDVQEIARKYLVDSGRTVVTLSAGRAQ
jgi:zinc protease